MAEIEIVDYVGQFEFVKFGHDVPEGDFARFVVVFIKNLLKSFQLENETFPSVKPGRPAYALHKMLSLVYYAYSRGFTEASVIADLAKYHSYFKFVANGIEPDEDTINNFIKIWGCIFDYLLVYSVQMAKLAGFTNFNNVDVDGTSVKANNNKFNVIHKDDVNILINYYSSNLVDDEELKGLRLPARKFMNRKDMSNKDKLDYLKKILKRFDETGANTIPVNDMEAIHLYNKNGNPDVGYNIQTVADNESKMFICLSITQKATDHNQFPEMMNKTLETIKQMPNYACADAAYNTRQTLEYVEEMGLNALIDNNRSSKLRNGHANTNKFHKDNMDYDIQEDNFNCYADEKLNYQKTNVRWDEKQKNFEIERIYYNKEACAKCKHAKECCNNKYRVVKISGGILAINMLAKFEDYKNLSEYVKRFSTVEPLIGILKRFYHIDELLSVNLTRSQNKINLCGGSLNLKRLYNQFMEMKDVNEDNIGKVVKSFCEKTNALMFILRETKFPFLDEKLKLPYICESRLSELNLEDNVDDAQLTLFDVEC